MKRRVIRMDDLQRAADDGGGWKCTRCGATNWAVVGTWYSVTKGIRRRRVCRCCGQVGILTSERPDQ